MGRADADRRRLVLDGVGLLARLVLGAVWLASGVPKAADPHGTRVAVQAYQLLPASMADVVAAVLPYLEIALGVLLLVGLATRLTALLSTVVLLVFIGGVISVAARGLSIDCGCFGGGGEVAPAETAYVAEILRDLGFLALAGFLVVRPSTPVSVDRAVQRRVADPA